MSGQQQKARLPKSIRLPVTRLNVRVRRSANRVSKAKGRKPRAVRASDGASNDALPVTDLARALGALKENTGRGWRSPKGDRPAQRLVRDQDRLIFAPDMSDRKG